VSKSKSRSDVPDWILQGRQAAVIYDILAAPFEQDCDCQTCKLIRENEDFLRRVFTVRPRGSS
jgi:hypothetical protein